ncbi:DNA methyltransferase [Pullulanibacillus camelliae]|uniref:site-specific DNA-methyltransferase (adenine-specific) n=1 Tax=Pullulanibacillus camelliae TaxID=1707096 RepID=A0A8J2YK06_9BACL|nr:DNA adenine methylase [Pullulanibacillus camelliae]GGE47872.1 DNA methyltransferase [Pullulanibacillus camelliae]
MKRILNYPGSKWGLANWIIEHMPHHEVYLEPYFGSGAVFFNKQPVKIETINDIDSRVVNLFRVIRDNPIDLARLVAFTPLSREEYRGSYETSPDPLEDARRFLIRCWQAIGAKTSDITGWRASISANSPNKTRQWSDLPEIILSVTDRLKSAQIENQDALQLIQRYNRENVLIYADPPYVRSTRTNRHYAFEMDEHGHMDLIEVLMDHEGPVLLSGYDNPLYQKYLSSWHVEERIVSAEAGAKKKECLWINPIAAEQMSQLSLFDLVEG